MCIIIITNPKHPISKNELSRAWSVNSDGAGYAYVNKGIIKFKKGFNDFETYWNSIKDLQKKHELLLHLRITSRGATIPENTHPFKVGDLLKQGGYSRKPVVAMNGTIHSQTLEWVDGVTLNDTASYIKDHESAFECLNKDIINIIADATKCRWASATTKGIIFDSDFVEHDGRFYSNLYHLYFYDDPYYYGDSSYCTYGTDDDYGLQNRLQAKHFISEDLLTKVKKDYDLWDRTEEYVYQHCNFTDCKYCKDCIANVETIAELKKFLEDNEDIDFFVFKDYKNDGNGDDYHDLSDLRTLTY